MFAREMRGGIRRAIVDDQDLQIWIVERTGVLEALIDRRLRVVRANDHAHRGPIALQVANVVPVPLLGHLEGRLRRSVATRKAEVPALDGLAAHAPRVRPREDAASGDAALHRNLELPIEGLGLTVLAFSRSRAVQSDLAEHERPGAGRVLKLGQIAMKGRA